MKLLEGILTLIFAGVFAAGCSQTGFSQGYNSAAMKEEDLSSQNLSCLQNIIDDRLDTSIEAFELEGGVSGGAGFGPSGVLSSLGVDVSYSSGNLDMVMGMVQPLYNTEAIMGSGSGTTHNFNVSASALVGLISGNIGFWHSTGLYTVSQEALAKTFANLGKALASSPQKWSTVISRVQSQTQFLIPRGSMAGVQVDDNFSIYKVNYSWQNLGAPCQVPLAGAILSSDTPYATATVQQVFPYESLVTLDQPGATAVEMYDWVEINHLVQPMQKGASQRTTLKLALQLGTVSQTAGLTFNNGQTPQVVDMRGFVKDQLRVMLSKQGGNYFLVP